MINQKQFYEEIILYKQYPCEITSMTNGMLHKGRHSTFCYGFIFSNEKQSFCTNFFVISKEYNPKEKQVILKGYISDSQNPEYRLSIEYDKNKTELLSGYNDQGDLMTLYFKEYFQVSN